MDSVIEGMLAERKELTSKPMSMSISLTVAAGVASRFGSMIGWRESGFRSDTLTIRLD